MLRQVAGDFLLDQLEEVTGFSWGVLHTGGGCFLLEAVFPYAWVNGGDRIWVTGDEVLDQFGSPESFGSRVHVCLMAGGIEATEEDKEEYCVAEAFRDTGAVWNEEDEELELSASRVAELIIECLNELGVEGVGA